MGWQEMNPAPVRAGKDGKARFEKTLELASVTTSDWIIVPRGVEILTHCLSVGGGGQGKVQFSNDDISVIKSGVGITAFDWGAGVVTVNTSDRSAPFNAFRLNQTNAGTTKLSVIAQ